MEKYRAIDEHHYAMQPSVRMTRACKRNAQTQPSTRGRQACNKEYVTHQYETPTKILHMYGNTAPSSSSTPEQAATYSMPEVKRGRRSKPMDMYSNPTYQDTQAQVPQVPGMPASYAAPTAKRGRRTRSSTQEAMQSGPTYSARIQTSDLGNPYDMRQRSNLPPRTSTMTNLLNTSPRYADQANVPANIPEQSSCRYNTRSTVNNVPVAAAPNIHHMTCTNRAARPPVTPHGSATQQISPPAPVARIAPTLPVAHNVHPEFVLSETLIKFIKKLRSKKIKIKKVIEIIEHNEYITIIADKDSPKTQEIEEVKIPITTYNEIISVSEARKSELLAKYIEWQAGRNIACILPFANMNPSLQYHSIQQLSTECDGQGSSQMPRETLPECEQYQQAELKTTLPAKDVAQVTMAVNVGLTSSQVEQNITIPTTPQQSPSTSNQATKKQNVFHNNKTQNRQDNNNVNNNRYNRNANWFGHNNTNFSNHQREWYRNFHAQNSSYRCRGFNNHSEQEQGWDGQGGPRQSQHNVHIYGQAVAAAAAYLNRPHFQPHFNPLDPYGVFARHSNNFTSRSSWM